MECYVWRSTAKTRQTTAPRALNGLGIRILSINQISGRNKPVARTLYLAAVNRDVIRPRQSPDTPRSQKPRRAPVRFSVSPDRTPVIGEVPRFLAGVEVVCWDAEVLATNSSRQLYFPRDAAFIHDHGVLVFGVHNCRIHRLGLRPGVTRHTSQSLCVRNRWIRW